MLSMKKRRARAKRIREGRQIRRLFTGRIMRSRFRNTTDLPLELIKEIYRAVVPPGVAGVAVSVQNIKRGASGRAQYSKRVLVRVGPDSSFPSIFQHYKGAGYLTHRYETRIEALVHIMAHELRHIWQYEHPTAHRIWGSVGMGSERDADAYAIRMVRAWRKAHYTEPPLFDPSVMAGWATNGGRFLVISTECGESLDEPRGLLFAQRDYEAWPRHIRKHLKIVPESRCEKFLKTYSDGATREKWRVRA